MNNSRLYIIYFVKKTITCKYTSSRPHINRGGVELGTEKNIRRPIPESDHFCRVALDRDPECSGQTKIRKLQFPILATKQLLNT